MDTALEAIIGPLRPYIQPITQSLPAPINDFALTLLGSACHKTLLLNLEPEPECVKLAISKGLGVGIILASSIVKIPQLLKLLNSKSAAGISFSSYLMELGSQAVNLAYNARSGFPFSTYGEQALIAAQNLAIAAAVLHFSGKSTGAAVFVAGVAAAGFALSQESIVGMDSLRTLAAGAGALGVASKIPQIVTIWQEGGTGQLSAFAVSGANHCMRCELSFGANGSIGIGLQLPLRIAISHIHDSARSRRPGHPLRLHRRLRAQCRASCADDLLLEQQRDFKQDQEQGRKEEEWEVLGALPCGCSCSPF